MPYKVRVLILLVYNLFVEKETIEDFGEKRMKGKSCFVPEDSRCH